MTSNIKRIRVIDSHTGGEPTRVVLDGFPDLGNGSMNSRLQSFKNQFDHLRSAIIEEPRGFGPIVGALLCEPTSTENDFGVIFFNNAGYLGMCGHGTIGLIKTLEFKKKIGVGQYKIETPVGIVKAELDNGGSVTFENVPSYRFAKDIAIDVGDYGFVNGDIAWGGNWFFLVDQTSQELSLSNIDELTRFTSAIKDALVKNGITGENDQEIDHIELFSSSKIADSKNFVLCPGREFDRSPCGTGTSAKLACLYEDDKIKVGEIWKQESIIGSIFEGTIKTLDGKIVPIISGTAHVTAEVDLILDENDPFCYGII